MTQKQGDGYSFAVVGRKLKIEIDLDNDSGRTPKGFTRVASSHGNQVVTDTDGAAFKLGLNCYR